MRNFYVYTPPGYGSGSGKYPVLYLLHGSGDTEQAWVSLGRANFLADTPLASGKATPMIIVMPFGHPQSAAGFRSPSEPERDRGAFVPDLLEEIIPQVERCTGHRRHAANAPLPAFLWVADKP